MFQRKRFIQRLFMPLPELEIYYKERRKYRFEQGKKLKYIHLREVLYPLFSCFLRLDRLARRQTVAVMGKQRKQKGPVIYACTHIGENDLENIYEALQRGCWWFVGDPCVLYKTPGSLCPFGQADSQPGKWLFIAEKHRFPKRIDRYRLIS